MGGYEILLYYYIAWILAGIGLSLLFNSLFFIKKKSGKVVLGIGLILLVPIGCFKVYEIRSDIERWNRLGPFFQAIDKNKYNKVKQLIEEGQDVNKDRISYPATPLTYAINKGEIRIVQLLVENGADVNYETYNHWPTPLEEAIDKGDIAIVNYLLEHGANVSSKGDRTSIVFAIKSFSANKEIVEALLKHGADINGNDGEPLKGAVSENNYEIARCLLEHGATVEPYLPQLENQAKRNFAYIRGRKSNTEDSLQTVKILELLDEYSSKKAME